MNMDIQVVISGIAGLFPRDENIQGFKESILANECLIGKSRRFAKGTAENEHFLGEISYKKFDHLYYGMNRPISFWTDPSQRLACERGLEAIIDAGINPETLHGTLTNVYYATAFSEISSRAITTMVLNNSRGYGIMGSNAAMAPNRVSFAFNFKGKSSALEGSGSSFPMALQNAWKDITSGACERALVFGTTIARSNNLAVQFQGLGMHSLDHFTRSFDHNGAGAALGDGSVALLLQRASEAKRCYATLLHSSGGMVSSRAAGQFTVLSPDGMERFLRAAYLHAGQDPRHLAYLEADGLGVPLRDELELLAHERALLPGRSAPLLVGSVKSNVGHLGNVSGAAAICKAIIAMEAGIVPATINCTTPNPRVQALRDGRMQVVTLNTPLDINENALVGVTSLGFGGDIGHVILKPNMKEKNRKENSSSGLPCLVILSGRSEEAVARTLSKFQAQPFDAEYVRLVQDVYSAPIRGYEFRTFTVCPPLPSDTVSFARTTNRSLWFVYSGMGSQWPGMGGDLMQLPVFRDTIQRLHDILLPKGLDLKAIIRDTSAQAFDDVMHSFVATTATQIALTNILTALGLAPSGLLGHSLGELACGHADGCLSEEQAILAAWARGRASKDATLIKGMMAAVGIGYEDIRGRLPASLDVACRNSSSSCTLSGPAEEVEAFVSELVKEGVFARSVNTSDIAYHSRYVAPAGPLVRRYLEGVIPSPRPRSSRWVSTSAPRSRWDRPEARLCSVEYLTNNLLSPVLFEEGLRHVPESALLVEVAPHGLLQAILKRAMPDAQHEALCRRGHHSQLRHLLAAIGSTSFGGQYPTVSALSPDVAFPVSRGTPSLSPLVEWIHDEIYTFDDLLDDMPPIDELYELNDDSPFMKVQETRLFPLSHMLLLVWKSLALIRRKPTESFGVVFEDVHILDYVELPEEGFIEVNANVMRTTGRFVVTVSSSCGGLRNIASGRIRPKDDQEKPSNALPKADLTHSDEVTAEEVHKELEVRGYCYSLDVSSLSCIQCAKQDWLVTADGAAGLSRLMEALLQAVLLRLSGDAQALVLPNYIRRLEVDPAALCDERNVVAVQYHLPTGIMQGRGIYMAGLTVKSSARPSCPAPRSAVKELRFVPYGKELELEELVCLVEQLLSERSHAPLTLLELQGGAEWVQAIQRHTSKVSVERVGDAEAVQLPACGRGVLTACGPGELHAAARLQQRLGGLVLSSGPTSEAAALGLGLCELARCRQGALLCRPQPLPDSVRVVQELLPATLACGPAVLVLRGASMQDIASAVRAASSHAIWLRLVFILDPSAPPFSLTEPLYARQLQLGLFVNVLLGGQWGSWKQMPATSPERNIPHVRRTQGTEMKDISFYPVANGSQVRGWARGRPVEVMLPGEMALGWSLPGSSVPLVDPLLRWSVPRGWSTATARTAPWAYAMAYLAFDKAQARRGESVLVLDAASPVGQAACRVAGELGCEPIFATVASEQERGIVQALSAKVRCMTTPRVPLSLASWLLEGTRRRGVDLVLCAPTGLSMHLALGVLAKWGRIVHTDPHAFAPQAQTGMWVFKLSAAFYGVTGDQLVSGSQELRQAVARAVSRGIALGTVQPIVQRVQINAESGYCSKGSDRHLNSQYREELETAGTCSPDELYVIGGGDVSEWPAVAESLWRCGARHVMAVGSPAAPRYRLRHLTRLGLQVRHLGASPISPGQLIHKAAAVILLLKESDALEEAASPWQSSCAELQVPLLLLRRSQLLQLPALLRAARPGATLLLPADPASTAVSGVSWCSDLPASCWLPGSLAALSSLGSRLLSLRRDAVLLRQVRGSRSLPSHCGEAVPLVALPPLGALHSDASLSALAARLLCPVLCAESRPRTDLRGHANDIAQAVLRWQWAGPLGLLGWGSSAALAVEVALQLQAAGRSAVTFLLGGTPDEFRTRAATLAPADILAEAVAGDAALHETIRRLPADSEWPAVAAELSSLSESSGVSSVLVAAGLEAVRVALQAAVSYDIASLQIPTHLHLLQIRSSSKFSGAGVRLHRLLREEITLSSERVALVLNEHGARPQDASDAEVRQLLERAASRERHSEHLTSGVNFC